jgi:hypothetical protein
MRRLEGTTAAKPAPIGVVEHIHMSPGRSKVGDLYVVAAMAAAALKSQRALTLRFARAVAYIEDDGVGGSGGCKGGDAEAEARDSNED